MTRCSLIFFALFGHITLTMADSVADSVKDAPVVLSQTYQGISFARFHQLAERVRRGDTHARSEFARVAIQSLVDSYLREVDRANAEKVETREERQRINSWTAGTLDYVERLTKIQYSINPSSKILVLDEPFGQMRLIIDGQQFMLNAPRAGGETHFQKVIASEVCASVVCGSRAPTIGEKAFQRQQRIEQAWSFDASQRARFAASDGLQCVFADRTHLNLKRAACEGLLGELRLLAEGFRALSAGGYSVDWASVRIKSGETDELHKVIYDRNGRYFRLELRSLYRAKSIWKSAVPWLKAQVGESRYEYSFEPPDSLVYLAG